VHECHETWPTRKQIAVPASAHQRYRKRRLERAGAKRTQDPTSTLADLYDPLTMPAPLLKAHQQLDRAVDRCYRPEPFPSDRHRVEYLFALYEQLTAPLVAAAKPARKGRGMQTAS
jgi:hypothetical protein